MFKRRYLNNFLEQLKVIEMMKEKMSQYSFLHICGAYWNDFARLTKSVQFVTFLFVTI